MTLKRLFGKFSKVEKQEDGTLYVEGIASTESVDSQGEIVKASAIAAALPDYMKFGALREMHQAIAAGKTLSASVDAEGVTHIACKVVDPVAIKKVEEGVYSGFSIGGNVTKRGLDAQKNVIEGLKLVEISLVDRPANPEAVISLFKADAAEPADGAVPATDPTSAASKAAAAAELAVVPPAAAEPSAAAAPAAKAEPVAKGMYTVQWAAELCSQLAALASDTQWEADFEGDASPIPARIKAACSEFCAILRDLVAEETAELVGDASGDDALAMVNKPGALKKSERVAGLARGMIAAAKTASAETEHAHFKAEDVSALVKFVGSDAFKKAMSAIEPPVAPEATTLEKRAGDAEAATALAGEALKKINGELDTLKKAHAETEKQLAEAKVALQTKGSLQAVPVTKADDTKAFKSADGKDIEDPVELTKMIHATAGRRIA